MKRYAIIIAALALLMLCGCEETSRHPYFEYRNSENNLDPLNRKVKVQSGYVLDEGHSYDIVETESGYDITFHLRRAGE